MFIITANNVPFKQKTSEVFRTSTGLDLESGAQYFFIVRAVNLAGLPIESSSDGFTVDFTPPTASEVRLGDGPELIKYQSDLTQVTIR